MKRLLRFALGAWIPLLMPVSAAIAQTDPQAVAWLQRIQAATQRLSYAGTFVHQHGDQMQTSAVTRHVNASGRQERLESLSGPLREVIRAGEQVTCYLPESRTVRIERQVADRSFPAILPGQIKDLTESYQIRKAETERVAGHDCQVIVLTPKDRTRYGHKLWADVSTGMLLKARTFDERGIAIETFEFTQLQIGGIDPGRVKSRYSPKARDWRVEDSLAQDANLLEAGWVIKSSLPGFRKIGEMRRNLGGTQGVGHIVLSDGLAAVSVFIEPWTSRPDAVNGIARQGATNAYSRRLGDHRITVVGDAPADSVKYLANAIEYRKPQ